MKRHPSHPWIVDSIDDLLRLCERCGKSIAYKKRQTLTDWRAMMKLFVKNHRECREEH